MDINIRPAVPADAPDMAEIHMRSWEVAYKDIIPADYIHKKNATRQVLWQRIVTDENTSKYVIQVSGKTAGFMEIAPSRDDDADNDTYELHGIYLHPDYFRQGIGTQAMRFAFDKARSIGKTVMTLWVFAENTNSVSFYEKCGFAADGNTKTLDCGKSVKAIRMSRNL
ncbi:GNAT family N-acetyltransferase [Clostridia bacterium]|nr:GNAT family N-acetyltransferase [Clostridia bacterium]